MNPLKAGNCQTCPFRNRHIYVVGSQHFGMELLVNYLAQNIPAVLTQVDRLDEIPTTPGSNPLARKLILHNCLGSNTATLRSLLRSRHWIRLETELLALLNVSRQLHVEEEAADLGVRGLLYDDDHIDILLRGICAINKGELWYPRLILSHLLDVRRPPARNGLDRVQLSQRERQILELVAAGMSNDVLAERLFISPHTIKTHLYNIFRKIGVKNRLQAARWLQNLGVIHSIADQDSPSASSPLQLLL